MQDYAIFFKVILTNISLVTKFYKLEIYIKIKVAKNIYRKAHNE